jgi:hypothetical protein
LKSDFKGGTGFFQQICGGSKRSSIKKTLFPWPSYGPKQLFLLQEKSGFKNVDFTPL